MSIKPCFLKLTSADGTASTLWINMDSIGCFVSTECNDDKGSTLWEVGAENVNYKVTESPWEIMAMLEKRK